MKNGIYNIAGGGIRAAVTLATVPLLNRTLGPAGYGLWSLVFAVIAVIGLVEGGLAMSTTVFVSRELAKKDFKAMSQTLTITMSLMVTLATLASLVLWFGADTISGLFAKLNASQKMDVAHALRVGGVVIWVRLLQAVFIGIEQAWQRYGLMNFISTAQTFLAAAGMVVLAWKGDGIVSLMQWQALMGSFFLLVHGLAVWRLVSGCNLRFEWRGEKRRELVHFSGLTWLTTLGMMLFSQCDKLIVGALFDASTLGVYATFTGVAQQINGLSALPAQPLSPLVSNSLAAEKGEASILVQPMRQALQLNAIIAFALGAGLIVLASVLVPILLSRPATPELLLAFRIAALIYTLYSLNAVGYYVLYGLSAVRTCTVVVCLSGVTSLLGIALGGAQWQLLGAMCGNAGYIATLVLTISAMKRLGITGSVWRRWLVFPIIWFAVVSSLGMICSGHILGQLVALFLGFVVLAVWYFHPQDAGRVPVAEFFQLKQ